MKNIHVLPTDKPSRLTRALHYNNSLRLVHKNYKCDVKDEQYQNMYITSDEEIKEGDWYYNERLGKVFQAIRKSGYNLIDTEFKIILTTDQDLIKDGVQAIDDEFLEWFVKNPSCEEVEVKHKDIIQYGNMTMYDHNGDGSHYFCKNCEVETSRSKEELLNFGVEYYKIIIPKEEPVLKCELCKTYPRLEGTNKCESCYSVVRHVLEQDPRFKDALLPDLRKKQETLEEAAEKLYPLLKITNNSSDIFVEEENLQLLGHRRSFIKGAKWQAEKMYSEEEVKEILFHRETHYIKTGHHLHINEWFEQFKKK